MAELRAPELPNEIYLRIANHLAVCSDDRELFRLRLISQVFTQDVDNHFLDVYYTTRVCSTTIGSLRNLGFTLQDLTLASFTKTLTIDENIASGVADVVGYLDLIQNILQTEVDTENRMTLTIRLNGAVNSQCTRNLGLTLVSIRDWAMNSSNNPIERFQFDMNAPFQILSERGTVLYDNIDPYVVKESALLFKRLSS